MGLSVWQILIIVAVFVLLFGRGKISELMGDVAKGIKSFKKGIQDDEPDAKDTAKTITAEAKPVETREGEKSTASSS